MLSLAALRQEGDELLLPGALLGGKGDEDVPLPQLQGLPDDLQGWLHLAFLQLSSLLATTISGQPDWRNHWCMVRSLAVGWWRMSTMRTPAVSTSLSDWK